MSNEKITLFSEIKKYVSPAIYAFIISAVLLISVGNKDLIWLKDLMYNLVVDVSITVISTLSLIMYFAFSSMTNQSNLMLHEYPVVFVFLSIYFLFIITRLHFEKQTAILNGKGAGFSNKMTDFILSRLFIYKSSSSGQTNYTMSSSLIYVLTSLFITSFFAFIFSVLSTSLLILSTSYGVSLTPDATSYFYGVSKFFYDGTAYISMQMSSYSDFPFVTMIKNVFPFTFFAECIVLFALLVDKNIRKRT